MDSPDNNAAEFERRSSRRMSRMSRSASVRTTGDTRDAESEGDTRDTTNAGDVENDANNDAYAFDIHNQALAAVVSDGFRPSPPVGRTAIPSSHLNTAYSQSTASRSVNDGSTGSTSSGSPSQRLSRPSSLSSVSPSITLPASRASPPSPSHSHESDSPPQSGPALPSSAPTRTASIAKPPVGYTLFPAMGGGSRRSRASGSNSDTASIASSSVPRAQVDEPYQGPSGPSFPYQLYPQNVRMARTPSTSTTLSAVPEPDGAYTGPRRPTFPYSMYPQTAMAVTNTVPVAGITVGFSGVPDNYQRRIGPDGEDLTDMIGPDGHTEQLPPYSKYPEDTYARKLSAATSAPQPDPLADSLLATASVPRPSAQPSTVPIEIPPILTVTEPHSEVPEVPQLAQASMPLLPATAHTQPRAIYPVRGAGGLGLAPRDPEFDAAEDPESPHSRQSLRSFNSDGSGRELNTTARGINEKRRGNPTALQRIGGRRLMGLIPCWAICLLITALVVMAVILGAVIGSFVTKHKRIASAPHPPAVLYPTAVTVTVDATPIPTPSGLPALPTGTFFLPLQREDAPCACFNDSTQASAWSCSIPYVHDLAITIDAVSSIPEVSQYNISFSTNMSATFSNSVFWYGEQPPTFGTPMPLQLVSDTVEPNRGPAWFRMVPFNKTVIVPETKLRATPTTTPLNRRDSIHDFKTTASYATPRPFSKKYNELAGVGDKPWVCTWPDTVLEVFIYPQQNISLPWPTSMATGAPTPPPGTAAYGTATTATPATPTAPPTAYPTPMDWQALPPPYPRVVKMEERRMSNSPQATCVQYVLKQAGDGVYAEPNVDAKGNQVEIVISEIESGPSLWRAARRGNSELEARDAASLSQCGCLWMMS